MTYIRLQSTIVAFVTVAMTVILVITLRSLMNNKGYNIYQVNKHKNMQYLHQVFIISMLLLFYQFYFHYIHDDLILYMLPSRMVHYGSWGHN